LLVLSLFSHGAFAKEKSRWAKSEAAAAGQDLGKLPAPFSLAWRMPVGEARSKMESQGFSFVSGDVPVPADSFVQELRFAGLAFGEETEHVALIFFSGELTAVTVSFATTPLKPASRIWESVVGKLESELGAPAKRTKPMELLSIHAVLAVLPEEADKSKILSIYKTIAQTGELGLYVIKDLQIQVKDWIPEATWIFNGGTHIKVFIRSGATNEYGLKVLKPAVTYAPLMR